VFSEAYLWSVFDADTPRVLVPLQPFEYGVWAVIAIRVRDLKAPEQNTPDGKRLTEAVKDRLLRKWTRLTVHTYARSFTRYQGDIWLETGESYKELCEALMAEMGIQPGGR
jgi:hypothetical protein